MPLEGGWLEAPGEPLGASLEGEAMGNIFLLSPRVADGLRWADMGNVGWSWWNGGSPRWKS
jgi:hypothetical protein